MKRILLVDNTFDPPHGSPEIRAHLEAAAMEFGDVEVLMVRGPDGMSPVDVAGFDGAVLSGSKTRIEENAPWISKEMETIRQLHKHKIPTLGICYGEQLIARTLGGDTVSGVAKTSEYGWAEVEIKGDSPILRGLSPKFHTYEFHSDEVFTLPSNFRLTASSPACPIQAFDVTDAPMWGVQFHPERELEAGQRGLERKMKADPNFKPMNFTEAEKLYSPSVGKTIFRNFLSQVWGRK